MQELKLSMLGSDTPIIFYSQRRKIEKVKTDVLRFRALCNFFFFLHFLQRLCLSIEFFCFGISAIKMTCIEKILLVFVLVQVACIRAKHTFREDEFALVDGT